MKNKKINVFDVANYVISQHHSEQKEITHLILQKKMYYLQGHFLGKFNVPLFDAQMEAWGYGPVIPDIYFSFQKYKNKPILEQSSQGDIQKIINNETIKKFIDKILKKYNKFTASELIKKPIQNRLGKILLTV